MKEMSKKFPEFKTSANALEVPWDEALVWVTFDGSSETFHWLLNADIRYLSWTNGILSVIPHPDSVLSSYFQSILINSPSVFVGKNIKVSN
ncbi:MAG: hypothetical protein COT17_02475 [Elusimicrobia bacterium CG08_land_8_20_14_0_20_51_18]|nr:MAG: hypothetical protein COT17_02475 [Elusimicrobia bacterium CG08_land_8_20_14_0_20_51_18]